MGELELLKHGTADVEVAVADVFREQAFWKRVAFESSVDDFQRDTHRGFPLLPACPLKVPDVLQYPPYDFFPERGFFA